MSPQKMIFRFTETLNSLISKRRRKQTEGPLPILPKSAITQLNDWATKNGFSGCKFYDIDMLYPSDEEIEKFFIENPADIPGDNPGFPVGFTAGFLVTNLPVYCPIRPVCGMC